MCQFLDIKDFGHNDSFIINNDLDKDSISAKELDCLFSEIKKQLFKNPATRQLNMFFFACHGIDRNSEQNLVLNEFDPETEFYKLVHIE